MFRESFRQNYGPQLLGLAAAIAAFGCILIFSYQTWMAEDANALPKNASILELFEPTDGASGDGGAGEATPAAVARADSPTSAPPPRDATGIGSHVRQSGVSPGSRTNRIDGGPDSRSNPPPLQIEVNGLPSDEGRCMIAIYRDAFGFNQVDYAVQKQSVVISGGHANALFSGLAAGTYAIAVYHDANDNGMLDRNILGIPTEVYAFSNDARGKRGPPTFEQAMIKYGDSQTKAVINVQ